METTFGVPYPVPTDPVSHGADDIRAVAEALDSRVLAGEIAWGDAGAAVDTWLRRIEANALGTPGNLYVSGPYFALANGGIYFGATWDAHIFRAGVGQIGITSDLVAQGQVAAAVGAAWQIQAGYTGGVAGISFGVANDAALIRWSAGVLALDAAGAPGSLLLKSGTPGAWIELGQVGSIPGAPSQAAARIYDTFEGGKNALYVVWPSGARTRIAIEP